MEPERLATQVQHSREYVSSVEQRKRWPSYEFVRRCDTVLNANGALVSLWPALVDERRAGRRRRRSSSPLRSPTRRAAPRRVRIGLARRCIRARVLTRRHPAQVGPAVGFVPDPFAIHDRVVVGWGMTLPDGSAVLVDWRNGPSSVVAVCRSPAAAARLVGGQLLWLSTNACTSGDLINLDDPPASRVGG